MTMDNQNQTRTSEHQRNYKHKILFVIDYPKQHFFKEDTKGSIKNIYMDTAEGKHLRQIIREEFSDAGITEDDAVSIDILFAYNQIPKIDINNKHPERIKYEVPKTTDVNKFKESLFEDIIKINPDIIIPVGNLAIKPLLNTSSISKVQGQGEQVKVNNQEFWVIPTYSPAYALMKPDVEPFLRRSIKKVGKFLVEGDKALETEVAPSYIIENDIEKFKQIFKRVFQHGKSPEDPIAWDLETTTLSPEREGADILTISFAFHTEDGKYSPGITIPVHHPEHPWTPEEQELVDNTMIVFANSDLWKVGHNIKFDMKTMRFVFDKGLRFKNNMDTMVAYYLTVTQDSKASFGLKQLAHYYTPYANYEEPLNEVKKYFKLLTTSMQKVHDGKIGEVDVELPKFLTDTEKEQITNRAKLELEKADFIANNIKTVSGEEFTYEWIPYSVLTKYAGTDALVTLMAHDAMMKDIKANPKFYDLYTDHYTRVTNVVSILETNGLQLDIDHLEELRDNAQTQMNELKSKMFKLEPVKKVIQHKEMLYLQGLAEHAKKPAERDKAIHNYYNKYRKEEDRSFSPTSDADKKLAVFHYGGLELPPEKDFMTDKGLKKFKKTPDEIDYNDFSIGKASRKALSKKYPEEKIIDYLSEYADLAKVVSTYTDSWIEQSDSRGVIHGSFSFTGTETSTGR